MAWPKRGTRQIVVDGEPFAWHYDAHCLFCSDDVLTAGRPGAPHVLFIDPYPWGFEIRPANVAAALRWATSRGWSPERGPTRALAWNDAASQLEWLADGQRHIGCKPPTPEGV